MTDASRGLYQCPRCFGPSDGPGSCRACLEKGVPLRPLAEYVGRSRVYGWPCFLVHERQHAIWAERAADAGYSEPIERDWRDQTVADVEEMRDREGPGSSG